MVSTRGIKYKFAVNERVLCYEPGKALDRLQVITVFRFESHPSSDSFLSVLLCDFVYCLNDNRTILTDQLTNQITFQIQQRRKSSMTPR